MVKLLYTILFLIGMACIVLGHKTIGPAGLGTMLSGLLVLIGCLWLYNRKHQ